MANGHMKELAWIDIPIEITTDRDGNYDGVLIKRIDRFLVYQGEKGEKDVQYEIVDVSHPMSQATINDRNDIMIVIENMEADNAGAVVEVRAFTETATASKMFRIEIRRLPRGMYDEIENLSQESGRSTDEIIRMILDRHLDKR